MAPPNAHPILTPHSILALRHEGTILTNLKPGWLYIHKRRSSRGADVKYTHIPLPTTGSVIQLASHFEKIPSCLVSLNTLRYLGFGEKAASAIWQGWVDANLNTCCEESESSISSNSVRSYGFSSGDSIASSARTITNTSIDSAEIEIDNFSDKFVGMIRSYIHGVGEDTCSKEKKEWRNTMDELGISRSLQDTILNPFSSNMQCPPSCKARLLDLMEKKYTELKDLRMLSDERVLTAKGKAANRGSSGSESDAEESGRLALD